MYQWFISVKYQKYIFLLEAQKNPLSGGLVGGRDASVGALGLQPGQALLDVTGILANGEESAAHVITGLGIALVLHKEGEFHDGRL